MRAVLRNTAPASVVEFVDGEYHWRVAADHADFLRVHPIDWLNLVTAEQATLVKRNSRRDVWRVDLDGHAYFAKLYHPNDLIGRTKVLLRGSTAMLEWNVGLYAAAYGIATVLPVATALKGFRGVGGPSLLITDAVPDVVPLNEFWLEIRGRRAEERDLADSLARLIARAHQCGFHHGDMHPGNILVRRGENRGESLFVDLHDVITGAVVSRSAAVANLAQLNQWFRRHANLTMRCRFMKAYLEYRAAFRNASPFARDINLDWRELVRRLDERAIRHADALWAKRDRRTRRNSRYFTRIRPAPGWRGHALLRSKHPSPTAVAARFEYKRSQWDRWLKEPLAWVHPDRATILKNSHTATVSATHLPVNGESPRIVVKRSLPRNIWKRIGFIFGRSRNLRAWKMANMLLNRDLPVAQPLAVVEQYRMRFFRTESILLTDFVEGATDLEIFLRDRIAQLSGTERLRVINELIESMVALHRLFHDRGFSHRDFKAQNILIRWDAPYEGRPQLTLVDMDGIRYVGRTNQKDRERALVRLAASVIGNPGWTRTDYLRFLSRYLTAFGHSDQHWKARWREIERAVSDKLTAKEARRQWKLRHYGRE